MSLLLTISCTRQKNMIYLQGVGLSDSSNLYTNPKAFYNIHPGDVLYIRIISPNKDITELFNIESAAVNSGFLNNEASMYYKGYTVMENGSISLPVIGEIKVAGFTIEELQKIIQQKVDVMLKDAYVVVKFGGFRFTVLGEVRKPGIFFIFNTRLSLLEALGEAGDITDYGNRKNILIVRPTMTGVNTFRVNLLDKDILQNPDFYLTPNDVVYVEPIKTKNWRLNAYNVSIILSSITTMILVINFILRF